jgi:hypothetical protein
MIFLIGNHKVVVINQSPIVLPLIFMEILSNQTCVSKFDLLTILLLDDDDCRSNKNKYGRGYKNLWYFLVHPLGSFFSTSKILIYRVSATIRPILVVSQIKF